VINLSRGLDFTVQTVYDDEAEKVRVRGYLQWTEALRREEKWAMKETYMFALPAYSEWKDCCVLPAVVVGMDNKQRTGKSRKLEGFNQAPSD
jgi:hypothetical protein